MSFAGDPSGYADPQGTGGADFVSAPMTEDTVLAGQPLLDLVASVTAPRMHLIGTVYDESTDGEPASDQPVRASTPSSGSASRRRSR